jgi:tRNA (guanine-N7-)-methyltransferase
MQNASDQNDGFDWTAVFGRVAPRVLDVGCGDGHYLLTAANAHPERDHVGIEVLAPLVAKGQAEAERRHLPNLRLLVGDAVQWLATQAHDHSLDEIHAYHPQPYFDPTVVGLGMLSNEFFADCWRVLRPDGVLVLQTDSRPYAKHLLAAAHKHFVVEVVPGLWPDAPQGRTRREEVALRKKLTILRAVARPRAMPLAITPPPPFFAPGRPGLQTVRSALRK